VADFDVLRKERREIAELTRLHVQSVNAFRARGRSWFKREADEPDTDALVRHKTTTATCIESLADTPITTGGVPEERARLASDFGVLALSDDRWESDGAAWIYCRVRALPVILAFASEEALRPHRDRLREHVRYVWREVRAEPRRQGIYELPKEEPDPDAPQTNYPPNAFHTAWALMLLEYCSRRIGLRGVGKEMAARRETAVLWTQSVLGSQIALHDVRSERADPNQLIWALIAQFANPARPEEPVVGEFSRRDLYRAALAAFFAQQLPNGTWPLGQPLFHYPAAGNAYCYTFETLTALLRPALNRKDGELLRELLRPFLPNLLKAWHYARETQMVLQGGVAVGWRSGHHPHRVQAEGWATASVFSYLQCLRRVIGVWTRDTAAEELEVRPPRYESPDKAAEVLAARGQTWTSGERWSAGEQLSALFLHPIAASASASEQLDPDLPLIEEDQARSAILFGPPGTSKTTLAEALAGAIGWDFVEIHAADFLSEGMDNVPRRADEIFLRLMELDHCVVLFDEIDELLRERQDTESDPFGRFLTTSMLPKVARLWEQRRVLFFVATNDIKHADRAMKRSQRFDAAIFIAPPSFAVKYAELQRRVPDLALGKFTEAIVTRALGADPAKDARGYFALLRWDQLGELAEKLRENADNQPLALENALRTIGGSLADSDWHVAAEGDGPDSAVRNPYDGFEYQYGQERRDYRMRRLVALQAPSIARLPDGFELIGSIDGRTYLRILGDPQRPPRRLSIDGSRFVRNALLEYRR
jgi:hypothetical protein